MIDIEPVKRVRGPFVYTEHRRYLDLDRLGGRALFGWREKRVMRAFRSVLAVGLSMPYPSYWQRRLRKRLQQAYPGYDYAFIADPLPPVVQPWREVLSEQSFTLVLPDLGLASCLYLYRHAGPPPAACHPSAAALAALCAAFGAWEHYRGLSEQRWKAWECPGWRRSGPWMWSELDAESYRRLRLRLQQERFLIPPSHEQPLCLPMEDLPAEARRWQKVLGAKEEEDHA